MSDKEDSKVLNVITTQKSENQIQERTARTQIQTNLPDVLKAQRTCPWLNHLTHENSKTNISADVHQLSWTQRNQVVVCTHRNATQQQQRQIVPLVARLRRANGLPRHKVGVFKLLNAMLWSCWRALLFKATF